MKTDLTKKYAIPIPPPPPPTFTVTFSDMTYDELCWLRASISEYKVFRENSAGDGGSTSRYTNLDVMIPTLFADVQAKYGKVV
jgi:hypothetical protein